jgi:hypothetical protein
MSEAFFISISKEPAKRTVALPDWIHFIREM